MAKKSTSKASTSVSLNVKELKDFLDNKRNTESRIFEKTTFCNTIYNAVVAITGPPQQNQ